MEPTGGGTLSAEQHRLVTAARAGDLDALRRTLAEGADTGTLGFHFAEAVKSALETGDTTWLKRTSKRALRPADAPHPHKVRARAFAESLGKIDLVSTQWGDDEIPRAWGFHVGPTEAAGGKALAIGVSAACPVLVLVRATPDRALATTVLARTLADVPSPQLYAGLSLAPPRTAFDDADAIAVRNLPASWRLVDPGPSFPADTLIAKPLRGRTFGMKNWREKVERRVARLDKLIELQAPESFIDDERRGIGLALIELMDTGWSREVDPLPAHVTEMITQVLDAFEHELDHGPSPTIRAEREQRRQYAALYAKPPRLRPVSADGHVERDHDDIDEAIDAALAAALAEDRSGAPS